MVSRAEITSPCFEKCWENLSPEISLARARVSRKRFPPPHYLLLIFLGVEISSYQATGIFLVLEHGEEYSVDQRMNKEDSISFKGFSQY